MKFISLIAMFALAACSSGGGGGLPSQSSTPTVAATPVPITKVYAYAGSQYTNKIYGFSLEAATGVLTPTVQGSVDSDAFPMIVATSRKQTHLFAANYSTNTISSYAIDANTGELTLAEKQALGAGAAPAWVSASPNLDVVYVANAGTSTIGILDFDPATGLLNPRTTVAAGSGVTALQFNKDGSVLYSADQNVNQLGVYSVDSQGNLSRQATVNMTAGSQVNALALSPDGRFLYTANWGTKTVSAYAISGTMLTQVGPDVTVGPVSSGGAYMIQVSPDGKRLYSTQPYGHSIATFDLNATTGAPSAAVQETLTGAVNIAFYKDYSFLIRWGNSANPLPIATRSYSSASGVGTTDMSATAGITGLYQLVLVEEIIPVN